jgi:protease-4
VHESFPKYLIAVACALTTLCGCAPTAYKITPVPADRSLEETTLIHEGGLAPAKIVLIDVEGLIINSRRFALLGEGEQPVALFTEKLDKAARDSSVKGLVLRINSPGGTVTASDLMYTELLRWKEKTGRPVYAVQMDVAASGAYYLCCACDRVFANRTTVTGSIGVIMQMVNFRGTMGKIGMEAEAIKSGEMKDAGSPLRRLLPKERELFQELVDGFYDRFVEVVATGRKMPEEKVREVADGRVYSAQQALELGFVDEIGTLREALACMKERIDARRVKVVTYQRPLGYKPNIYAETPTGPAQVNMLNIQIPHNLLNLEPQFLYLWSPGL